mmetsp:Transcript_16190/g.54420  ORF Transcript_16190/g.54420 Transcript_16190/m.54420 type:complete len:258 (+) Transcript_16190:1022-1795(+)
MAMGGGSTSGGERAARGRGPGSSRVASLPRRRCCPRHMTSRARDPAGPQRAPALVAHVHVDAGERAARLERARLLGVVEAPRRGDRLVERGPGAEAKRRDGPARHVRQAVSLLGPHRGALQLQSLHLRRVSEEEAHSLRVHAAAAREHDALQGGEPRGRRHRHALIVLVEHAADEVADAVRVKGPRGEGCERLAERGVDAAAEKPAHAARGGHRGAEPHYLHQPRQDLDDEVVGERFIQGHTAHEGSAGHRVGHKGC